MAGEEWQASTRCGSGVTGRTPHSFYKCTFKLQENPPTLVSEYIHLRKVMLYIARSYTSKKVGGRGAAAP